ncbi:sodium/proton antiporter (CPA1 family) [Mucilaginibacter frigoritolerans]|jgi:monovalent cation:H+ antiporter, CPA1 family|uniref:Sodium/proton antiporter (CPA1 family) n=1 Tax=Mucilaginibacter frigoritolerans TaxID=652788 RepID=A0A562U614_9SPHI|nr:sodium:proton antiporter [Mucilaginibacter frigoritolerans]TWJ00817.1 sodium/proton antiporter (CPA1 family) [Mucilaginibacter frigoritolerans]
MDIFLVITLLVLVSAFCSYLNARFVKLPGAIGIITIAIVVSVITIVIDKLNPDGAHYLSVLAKEIHFPETVLNIMLGFLLFASSFNANNKNLKKEARAVLVLSTVSIVISSAIFGVLFYGLSFVFNLEIPLLYCLLFGALISPTDPVAVSAVIKTSKIPQNLATIISGESLFNDGVGLVLFVTLLEIIDSGIEHMTFAKTAMLFAREVFGGGTLGLISGFIAFRLMKSINDFQTIVLISLSLVLSISVIGLYLHLSVPLAVVSAGLFASNYTINGDEHEHSHEALGKFWHLVDEMLNTVLFVMIGLQMINFPFLKDYWLTGAAAIIITLLARWISVVFPLTFFCRTLKINFNSMNVLTWAGLRGGISIALALSLPDSPYRDIILSASYFIVIFSIVVQGLTLNKVINRLIKPL